jgi:hypothetical protein
LSGLELIFGGMSALSAAVTAWVAVISRQGNLRKKEAVPSRWRPRWIPQLEAGTWLLAFASVATAAVGVYLVATALGGDSKVKEAPLLRAVIPATFASACVAEDPPDGAVASMVCKPSPRIDSAHYALFHDRDAMNRSLGALVAEMALPKGDCEERGFAVSPYGTEGEGNWGRLLCYVDEAGSHISWTNEDLRILASAAAPVGADNELYKWWQTEGGPLPTSNLKSFPNKSEDDLIEWIPAPYRDHCSRSSWGGRTAEASLVCEVRGVDALGYASYESAAEMRAAFESRLGSPKEDEDPDCAANVTSGDSSYDIGTERAGRLVCYLSDGTGYYEWTYENAWVTAYASREDGDMRRLFGWWRHAHVPE